ncbi:MAG: heme exporter protein CcmB [Bacteroidetes bacterium]|nr:heme exporter protein CcmB [Bacteroidota bacterium]
MNTLQNIYHLFKKDVTIEWRQKSTIASMFVYVISTVFVIYLSFKGELDATVWMAIYWIILLFVVVNLTISAFTEEAGRQFYYIRSIASAVELIGAKMLYNAIYFVVLSGLTLAILALFFGFPVENGNRFLLVAGLGSIGLANMFTLLAAITARIKNVALIAVLGFPVVIPLILICIRLSGKAMDSFFAVGFVKEIMVLVLLNVIIIAMSMILFTYLWRD